MTKRQILIGEGNARRHAHEGSYRGWAGPGPDYFFARNRGCDDRPHRSYVSTRAGSERVTEFVRFLYGFLILGRFAAERRKKGKAVSTVNSSLRVLHRILNKAVEWHKPEKGVFLLEKAPKIKLLKGENHRERVLTANEESAYLEKAEQGSLLSDFVAVLFDTAMRPEEAYRLRWECVAWEDGLHGDSTVRVTHGKTDNARRELPMSPRVRTILRFRWEAAGKPLEGWVWPAKTASGHMEPSSIKKRHTRACEDSRVKFVLYDVRHTSLTRLGCSGCDTWTFARIAGHGKIQMSTRYVHSHRMEGSGWWGQWFAARNAQRISTQPDAKQAQPLPDRSSSSDEFRYA